MQGAEGSSIQSIKIDATYIYIDMVGLSGSGGSHHDITIIGDKIEIDTRQYSSSKILSNPEIQPAPTMAHVTLINQTNKALYNFLRGPLVCVGWNIMTEKTKELIKIINNFIEK